MMIALDPAMSELYNKETKKYELKWSTGQTLTSKEMVDYWAEWAEKYPSEIAQFRG